MCVMNRVRVGIRELRQNLSVYVRRVLDGDSFEVTEHGRPVAVLGPLPEASTPLGRLVQQGRVRPSNGDLLDLGMPRGPATTKGSEALRREREERL
jgi:prevent-host-death family protein